MDTAWFKAKTAGLPRWAWLSLIGGGLVLGLYLRSKDTGEEGEAEEEYVSPEQAAEEAGLGYGEGGLAGAGLVGGSGTTNTPVQTPYIPEGFVSMFEQQGTIIQGLAQFIEEHPSQLIERESTGGGAPEPGYHEPVIAPTPSTPGAGAGGGKSNSPQCSNADVNALRHNANEINRLQGEINDLQGKVQQLTNNIQSHPNAKEKGKWQSERDAAQANIQGKRDKVNQLSSQNQQIRNKPGCGSVQV